MLLDRDVTELDKPVFWGLASICNEMCLITFVTTVPYQWLEKKTKHCKLNNEMVFGFYGINTYSNSNHFVFLYIISFKYYLIFILNFKYTVTHAEL